MDRPALFVGDIIKIEKEELKEAELRSSRASRCRQSQKHSKDKSIYFKNFEKIVIEWKDIMRRPGRARSEIQANSRPLSFSSFSESRLIGL